MPGSSAEAGHPWSRVSRDLAVGRRTADADPLAGGPGSPGTPLLRVHGSRL